MSADTGIGAPAAGAPSAPGANSAAPAAGGSASTPAIPHLTPSASGAPHSMLPPEVREVGEKAVLKHGRAALISDIRGAVTTKYNQIFLLTSESGDILATDQGYGLYFRDTRYLD